MRKLLVICLLLMYMLPSLGVFATTHYCGGNLTHIDFFAHDDEQDKCECAAITKNNCCSDKEVKVNLKTESTRLLIQHANYKPVSQEVCFFSVVPFITVIHSTISANASEKWKRYFERPVLRDLATIVIRF